MVDAVASIFGGGAAHICCTLAITPLERPDLRLARVLARYGVAVAIDAGRATGAWPELFASLALLHGNGIGLRIPDNVTIPDMQLPASIRFLVIAAEQALPVSWRIVPHIAQICSVAEAARAMEAGAAGLIAKGQESGGLVGDESSFVLLQRVVALVEQSSQPLPVWCQGGIGLNTAAGALAGGAFGVVIDSILAGFPESSLPEAVKTQILGMDGSEVHYAAGYQVYARGQREAAALASLSAVEMRAALAEGRLLPAGQDAAMARLVMAECPTVEALIKTMRMRAAGQMRQARQLRILDEGSAWARAHGTRYPVAQGPMTRVSDTAAFAGSVAEGGGLPFLALSMMKPAACRSLMESTRDLLGARPWGVGVLAFAAADIVNPQLDLVRELQPSFLVLAGGRPAQARPFVDMGIPTYLHVPSPGLLDMFLKDGATHFIFEGRECGGHVGPRYSFVLWEQALALLDRVDQPENLHILFAGGIHDSRSGAMVAVMAARLAARGAKIGVLMGSAYIATEEAVSCGAILAAFQQKALVGDATVLVETAPGHAIRCLPSGFMDLFDTEKARLKAEGVERKQAWRALESLTVGRLRVATKGLDYVDGVLSPIDAGRQEAEGMYMIGQVIAMRRAVTSVAALHAEVTRGACAYLDKVAPGDMSAEANAVPVAVIGMACLFPGSPDLESYWANILQGRDLVGEVPADRWNIGQYYANGDVAPGKSVSKWGGFIADTPFDPLKYGIPPQSLAAIEPVQLLSLEVASQAMLDAGYAQRWFDQEKTAVIFGAESGADLATQYSFRNIYPQYCGDLPPELAEALPSLTEDSFPGVLVNVISGRIANRLGLGGVNYAVDSACASSLTAVELGVKELRAGSSDMVLAGGADFHNGISDFLMFSSAGALSPTGRCRSFDDAADGICLGEGVGIVVLKRLADAERDGDRIYAVIDGVAGSSDGKGLGLTAPRKEGQKRALERAYWQAGVLPADIGLVEAHGTGTVVGDRTELKTLTEIYNAGGAVPGQTRLGSVKSQIGHTKCAAGIAGLIKVAKALHHGVLPPTRQITTPNAWHKAAFSPFRLDGEAAPWLGERAVARGAVSAFGFGGTNFHAVLSAYKAHRSPVGAAEFPAELFVVRGETAAAADGVLRVLRDFVVGSDAVVRLRDLAGAVWKAGSGPVQLAFVAENLAGLPALIEAALARGPGIAVRAADDVGKIACLFPGQGSQYPGMLRDLFVYFPLLRNMPDAADYANLIYPPTSYDEDGRSRAKRALTNTRNAQPALGLVELAAFAWLRGLGIDPDMLAGHSYGELAALAAAGAFDSETLLRLSRARADCIMAAVGEDPGAMAAVRLDAAALAAMLTDFPAVAMANQNSPIQTVISGPTEDVRAACAVLERNGVATRAIATGCAFHSPLMGNAENLFAEVLAGCDVGALRWPVYSNVDAAPHANDAASVRASLARHIVSPVRFVCEIQRMYDDGARVFLEIGPRQVLTGLVGGILKDRPYTAIALDAEARGLAGIFAALARMAVVLPGFDASALFAGRTEALNLHMPLTIAATTWMVNGGRAWPRLGKLPAHAAAVVKAPVVCAKPSSSHTSESPGEDALVGYLSNMRDLVNAQRDVLLGYFGATPVHRAAVAAPIPVVQAPRLEPALAPARTVADEQTILLAIVSERTGYPADMLDLDLDLEADLSIDSIKRLEIIGILSERLSMTTKLGGNATTMLEQLASEKTLRAMIVWLREKCGAPAAVAGESVARPTTPAEILLHIVSNSTGYPLEALDLDLDLEADLSIDSIKRAEIAGQFAARAGVAQAGGDAMLEGFSALKTLRAMIAFVARSHGAPAAGLSEVAAPAIIKLDRYVLRSRRVPAPVRASLDLSGQHFLITDDGRGLAPHVAALLGVHGATARIVAMPVVHAAPTELARADGLIHLGCLNPQAALCDVKILFTVMREALLTKTQHLLVVSGLGGDFGVAGAGAIAGGGVAGLVKAVAKEFPSLRAHVVDVDVSEPPACLAAYIEHELLAEHPLPEVAYQGGHRYVRDVVSESLQQGSFDDLALTQDSVVLLTGGARGITALAAVALAQRTRCHMELVGRSPAPASEEDALTKGITDHRALRQTILQAAPGRKPAEVERLVQRLLADRDARATLSQIRQAGSRVNYTALDVRENRTFAAHIAGIYERYGRIDGVIHGAGVVEDRLMRDKTDESFGRVFDTKVQGATVLHDMIRDDVRFVVFFSSVASAFGNRGQADYACANDVLDKLAYRWQSRIAGRVLSVNWGPWADTGMVSDALRNEYHRKGIGLIAQKDGVEALLRELSSVSAASQVVLMCGTPESFGGRSQAA